MVAFRCDKTITKISEYSAKNWCLDMLLKFWTFFYCKTGHLEEENMINIGLGHNFGNINAILVKSAQAG